MIALGVVMGVGMGYGAPNAESARMDPQPIIDDVRANVTSGTADQPSDVDEEIQERYGIDTHAELGFLNRYPRIETPADPAIRTMMVSLVVGSIRISLFVANAVGPIAYHVSTIVPAGVAEMITSGGIAAWLYYRIRAAVNETA